MNVGMISKRYAKALLEYAIENKSEDTVYSEMKKLDAAFTAEPRLRMAMDNPTLTKKDKLELIKAATGTSGNVLLRFLDLVLKNKRETVLRSMALSYTELYCQMKHINTAKLVTATPVGKEVADRMKLLVQQLKPGTLEFDTKIDPEIDGGFILYFDTYRMDASIKTQLKNIKQQFIEENSKML